jgi:hypothetical protein
MMKRKRKIRTILSSPTNHEVEEGGVETTGHTYGRHASNKKLSEKIWSLTNKQETVPAKRKT